MTVWLTRLLTAVALALAVVAVAPANVACACSCKELSTAEAVAEASAVFEGEVIATNPASTGSSADPVAYTLKVSSVFKGVLPEQVVVTSAASEASCGVQLQGTVVVFAVGSNDNLTTTLCSVPHPLVRSQLPTGRTPAPFTPSPAPAPTSTGTGAAPAASGTWLLPGLWLAAGVGVLGLAAVLVWARRRRP